MSSSDLMVKVEAEEALEDCEPPDLYTEHPIKEEPESEEQPQQSFAVNDSLTPDPLGTLASFTLEPTISEPVISQSCRICGHALAFNSIKIGKKGLLTLQRASERRQDGKFPPIQEEVRLHASCRASYIIERSIQAAVKRLSRGNTENTSHVYENDALVQNEAIEDYEGLDDQEHESPDMLQVNRPEPLESGSESSASESKFKGREYCRICGCTLTIDSVTVGPKGLVNLLGVSKLRQDNKFPPGTTTPFRLHLQCRRKYINERVIMSHVRKLLRREMDPDAPPVEERREFDYREQCLICGGDATEAYVTQPAEYPAHARGGLRRARPGTGGLLYRASCGRPGRAGEELRKRVEGKNLVALEARYHSVCYKRLTGAAAGAGAGARARAGGARGRPPSDALQAECGRANEYIENNWEDSQFHLDDIRRGSGTSVNGKSLVRKLLERCDVAFIKKNRVVVVTPGAKIPEDWYDQKMDDERKERLRIVRTAANIILEDIRSVAFDSESYPPPSSFLDDVGAVVPETLKTFVDTVVTKYKKNPESMSGTVTAVSHCMMTAARPRSFKSPLLLGIGSFINQNHTSKSLIELLSSVGFCAPYDEVTQFEISVAFRHRPNITRSKFTQFAFDVVDTEINGRKSQFVVGVQCVTPRTPDSPIVRRDRLTPKEADRWCARAPLETYVHGTTGLKNVTIEDHTEDTAILPTKGDALWLFGRSDPSLNVPGWDAFMSKMPKDKEYPLSEIRPLPVIHAPVSYDAVYTALKCAQFESSGRACVVTLDQPLYQIAQDIVNSDSALSNIVLRLGGFHLLMSYLGAVGYVMSGSGLERLWCGIYAAEQTAKMMTGHAVARAVRAHFLTRSALFNIITKDFDLTPKEKLEIEGILDGDSQTQKDNANEGVKNYQESLAITLELLGERGPTAQLWVQYFRMTTLMAQFIEAERTANWRLHLATLKKMLPYFHASGHFEYAKSCSLYLQDMQKLDSKMSDEEYENFTKKGYFTVRRTDKHWTDVWADLIVEQTMARLMRRPGGVANGRRVTDCVLGCWTDAGPALSAVADLVEDFCRTSEHQMYADEPIINSDNEDVAKLQSWFEEYNPFTETESLLSIETGVVGGAEICCHQAREIGEQMMAQTVGQNYHDVSYQRDECVLPLSCINSAVQIKSFKVPVEPDTILKRIHITKENQEEMKSYFDYELAPYPLSLFNDHGMIEGKKSESFKWFVPVEVAEGGNRSHVVDGEFLLRRVTWKEGADIATIINTYVDYVKAHFTNAIVVFGGHGSKGTTIKRSKVKSKSPPIEFQKDTVIMTGQQNFLSNEKNRDKLIKYLLIDFTRSGITVKLSPSDVDSSIVQIATVNASAYEETCVVSDNPDLLVIMTAHATKKNIYFMNPGRGKKPTTYYHVDSFGSNRIKLSIMFIHAVCGGDMTSVMFRKSRTHAGLTILSMPFKDVKDLMAVFKDANADANAIAEAGYSFMRRLHHYHGDNVPIDDLNVVRFEKFAESVTKSKNHLACLPPTREAVRQHMYRTYHQIQKWLGNDLPDTDWGWKLVGGRLEPIKTLAEPVPRELLDLISCTCTSMCTGECSCKRAGLDCCVLCVNCNGKVCHGLDMDADAYEVGYRILSGCDALGNPVDTLELANDSNEDINDDDNDNDNDDDDESEYEGTRPKRPRRDTILKDEKPNRCDVEQVYIVECQDQEPSV